MQKTSFKTRLLALLTAAFMVVMCVPFAAFADSTAEHKTISVQWTTTSGEKLHEPTTVAAGENVTAPSIEEGYVWSDVDYEKNTYNAGDTISFAEMEANISYWYQGEGSYAFRKVEAPKPTTKTIKINYYSEAEKKQIAEVDMTVAADATSVNSSKLTAPQGYELVESGDFPINDGYVYAAVKPVPTTKTIKINYYSEAEKKQIAEVDMTVAADATSVNSSKLTAPQGYELVESGDFTINDGYVYAAVRKVKAPATTKTIKINYYSEEEEKQIDEVEMTVPADATYVNTSALTAPAGYKLVLAGDLPIRDGYVYAAVRKVPTTTIKISYVDEATDKEVGAEDLVVNQGTTVVNFNVLKSVPAGYELCEVGDFYVGNGSAKVMVRKTKSNNGSSSSSASSSSNTTNTSASNTTNTSASQKQVVKAAAAPANTTKVLPKTGATNAAPLIGGSLAVVALLMGYGVYGLVLRKKD